MMIDSTKDSSNNGKIEKYCYRNDTSNCTIYGGLYLWDEAMSYTTDSLQGICPEGWHIPTDNEWKILEGTVDSQYGVGDSEWDKTGFRGLDAASHLKSSTGWYDGGNGEDDYNFTVLPGGFRRYNDFQFGDLTKKGYFWSSSEPDSEIAWYRILFYNNHNSYRTSNKKANGFSIRCIRD